MNQLAGSCHGHGLKVGGHIAQDCKQAVKQGLQSLVAGRDDLEGEKIISCELLKKQAHLVENNDEEIRVRSSEDWYVHGHSSCVWLVKTDTKVSFSTQKKQNKHT